MCSVSLVFVGMLTVVGFCTDRINWKICIKDRKNLSHRSSLYTHNALIYFIVVVGGRRMRTKQKQSISNHRPIMAFILPSASTSASSPFVGHQLSGHGPTISATNPPTRTRLHARVKGNNNNNKRPFRRVRGGSPNNFKPFDGSRPLLPPWRPESVEQDFSQSASRITYRETHTDETNTHQIVSLISPGYATLFAKLIQEVTTTGGKARVWLRPLLLDASSGFVDLRGANDLVLDQSLVRQVDPLTVTKLRVNLAATEADVSSRAAVDDAVGHLASRALVDFMRHLSDHKSE